MRVAIIGGGAAGFFSAIAVKENYPQAQVTIFEKLQKPLVKVKLTGGGRCNLTNAVSTTKDLISAYPRGGKLLKQAFRVFDNHDSMRWFEKRGVPLTTQDDLCVFPVSQDSQTIIDCLINEAQKLGVEIKTGREITHIDIGDEDFELSFHHDSYKKEKADKIIVTTGGSPKRKGLSWLEELHHQIAEPIPSLFTFNMPGESIKSLMGIVIENVLVSLQGTKLKAQGPLLITHWGMSGPAILKLSSFGARLLSEKNYEFRIQVNWVNIQNSNLINEALLHITEEHPNKILANYRAFNLPERLWLFLLEKSELSTQKKWSELGKKGLNKLVNILSNDIYQVKGKTVFREEFVTCGGISLQSIDNKTLQSKVCKNLYFAGEVLDIDGITGGYNLQAAWTTAFIAGKLLP